ncbi:ubiquinol cytochrome-c reductase assembly protein Cbp3 [Ophiobolus disseminans]|uniref:Ubiquinol cytochrome-c reductase assembly protein Cbp3 n=1 Tax=Ophiobolus disseminans TaxID=1469910 RepID=A0A6A6ZGG6_9PLEO|nr:ubiquinol cytochrome-c reductase assembly protein Cbp3 [Ophiobolus disseminans]
MASIDSATASNLYHGSHNPKADIRPESTKKPQHPKPGVTGLAQMLRDKAPRLTETYVAYGAMRDLIKECSRPGEYQIPQALEKNGEIPTDENGTHVGEGAGWWYETLGLKPTFSNWAQITFVHMYMLQVRFRMFPQSHAPIWIQHLTNQAFYAAEDRLVMWHKFNANTLRQKHLKDMFAQWRAVLLSYDEGLVKGDAMLAAAVWRNLMGSREDVDFEKLAQIVGYMRRELKRLDDASDEHVANGEWRFRGDPGDEASVVKKPSKLMASEGAK